MRAARCSQTWAMLIKRVYEIDPLCCPKCRGQMKVVAFLEPPQGAVIEKILRHCGLWNPSTPRAPPPEDGWGYEPDADWDSQPDFIRAVRGTDLRRYRRVPGDLLILPSRQVSPGKVRLFGNE